MAIKWGGFEKYRLYGHLSFVLRGQLFDVPGHKRLYFWADMEELQIKFWPYRDNMRLFL